MSDIQSSGFLRMPVELRLDVYQRLFVNCLADGYVSDVAGLYLCCSEVRDEIEAEYMTKIRPLLQAKYEWESTGFQDEPLRFTLRPNLRAKAEETELSIGLPVDSTQYLTFDYEPLISSVKTLALSLRSAFHHPWSILRLSVICQIPRQDRQHMTGWVLEHFIYCLSQPQPRTFSFPKHIQRLVLILNCPWLAVNETQFHLLWRMFRISRTHFLRLDAPRAVKQAWISKAPDGDRRGWYLTLDFEQGLGSTDDALWSIKEHDGMLEAKRLFEGTDTISSEFEAHYAVPTEQDMGLMTFGDSDLPIDSEDDYRFEDEVDTETEIDSDEEPGSEIEPLSEEEMDDESVGFESNDENVDSQSE